MVTAWGDRDVCVHMRFCWRIRCATGVKIGGNGSSREMPGGLFNSAGPAPEPAVQSFDLLSTGCTAYPVRSHERIMRKAKNKPGMTDLQAQCDGISTSSRPVDTPDGTSCSACRLDIQHLDS
jgi:hypothetical protein